MHLGNKMVMHCIKLHINGGEFQQSEGLKNILYFIFSPKHDCPEVVKTCLHTNKEMRNDSRISEGFVYPGIPGHDITFNTDK